MDHSETGYAAVADLPLVVDGYDLEGHERSPSADFTRRTTVFALHGDGRTGRGEDVAYEPEDHEALAAAEPFEFAFEGTFGEFSDRLDATDLHDDPPARETNRAYRRWALESAALDLALRQNDTNLGTVLGRAYRPVRFVVSTQVESMDRIDTLLAVNPEAEFKLDPEPEWGDAIFDALAAMNEAEDRIRVLDLKGFYEGTTVDVPADPDLYERTLETFPDAVIEDAFFTDETRPLLEPEADRLSFDYPVHGVESVEALPVDVRWLNIKPSRFGTVESLLETVAWCEERDVRMYGGGQYELAVGRDQIQAFASLCYPDGPNDVAPRDYNEAQPPQTLPRSPLTPPSDPVGFGWD
jgi:L-alanine-DL-glutamate epimerase-like enolase superfamily enzyme